MSTFTSEPGTRLAGRYRLVDQVAAGSGWAMWKAIDETLARAVSVLTFAPGFPRVPDVVTAARAASRLTDPRLAQVFDVEDSGGQGGQAYVVLEWVGGDTLTDLLADGPLEPARACAMISDAARALAGAHAAGQAHLRLTPDALRWTRSSGVKITGLGIDAALAGDGLVEAALSDPSISDTRDLAALLYAALTGYWPGTAPTSLPPAPVEDDVVYTPRQVSADVSAGVDGVVGRALLQRTTRSGPPIQSPAAFADALAAVAPPVPLPEPAPSRPRGGGDPRAGYPSERGGYQPNPDDPATWAGDGRGRANGYPHQYQGPQYGGGQYPGQYPQPGQYRAPQHGGPGQYGGAPYAGEQRGGAGRAVLAVVVVLALVAVGAIVWALGSGGSNKGNGQAKAGTSTSARATTGANGGVQTLTPVKDGTFNIFGGDNEDAVTANQAIDSDPGTAWATDFYLNRPNFGGLKQGTGLIIDMGKPVQLSSVEVLFGKKGGDTTAVIYVGNSAAKSKTALSNFTAVAGPSSAAGDHVFSTSSSATGRYVLIWLTSLPLMQNPPSQPSGTKYQGLIYNVVIRGSYATSAS